MAIKTRTCLDCRGEGYTLDGECERCNGRGSLTDGYVFTSTSWLYIPSRRAWINPDRIERVWLSDHGTAAIYFADAEGSSLWINDADDTAAVTAWLEARS